MTNKFVKNSHTQQNQRVAIVCFFHKVSLASLAALLVVCFSAVGHPTLKTEPIALRAKPLPFTPKEFYIADVIDEREDRTAVGYLLSATNSSSQPAETYPVDLQGGALTAIRQFIRQGLNQNTALRPVVIRLKECRITELPGAKGRVDGRVVLTMAFDLQRDGETIHLVEYRRGGAHYNRPASSVTAVEQALRQSLVSALRYLNTWMNQEADGNVLLAKGVKVFFTDYTQNVENDTVFYATDRPLTWGDFREKPRLSRYAASVFPSFAYESHSEIVEGILHINLTLKVFVLPNYSWVRDDAKDPYSLNHEQRHFDIVKLVVERFKQKVQPDSLTVEDYNSIIQWQYIESFREMNRLQEQYDDETRHGIDKIAQERWNRRIEDELRSFTAKK